MFTTPEDSAIATVFGSDAPTPGRDSGKDADIRLAILEAMHWDLAIPPGRVTIEVSEGWVVLTGRVHRGFARHRAEWAARLAAGVVGVTNAITVDG